MTDLEYYKTELEKLKAQKASTCPSCGHCPTCGRSAAPMWPQPWYQRPWYEPYPSITWTSYDTATPTPTVTTAGSLVIGNTVLLKQ